MSLVLDLLFPRTCYGCGRTGFYFCPSCRALTPFRALKPSFGRLEGRLPLFPYRGAVKDLINALKFNFTADLVPEITDYISDEFPRRYPRLLSHWQADNFVLMPIPLHPRRHAWRGFNQSELICQELSEKLNLKYRPDLLTRTKNSLPQSRIKDKLLRHHNLVSSFKLAGNDCSNIILVDDVFTTGSTILSAAACFPENSRLFALTLA